MTDTSRTPQAAALPPDDPKRRLAVVDPSDSSLPHVSMAGDTYTILLTGGDTGGRYCLIDMFVPPGGGPPPHRHDFEEMFTVLEGQIEVGFRGETVTAGAGATVNVPANAPHYFKNTSERPARLLCMCTPPGQEAFFLEVGEPVADRLAPPPKMSEEARRARMERALQLAPAYRTEILLP
jgi:quercetin dioxygenase-like cupin family protein